LGRSSSRRLQLPLGAGTPACGRGRARARARRPALDLGRPGVRAPCGEGTRARRSRHRPQTKAAPPRAAPRHASTHRAAPIPGLGDAAERSEVAAAARPGPNGAGGGREPEGRSGAGWRKRGSGKAVRVRPRAGIGPAAAAWVKACVRPPARQGPGAWTPPPIPAGPWCSPDRGRGPTGCSPPPPHTHPISCSQEPKLLFCERGQVTGH
jgi:hypothetical protein